MRHAFILLCSALAMLSAGQANAQQAVAICTNNESDEPYDFTLEASGPDSNRDVTIKDPRSGDSHYKLFKFSDQFIFLVHPDFFKKRINDTISDNARDISILDTLTNKLGYLRFEGPGPQYQFHDGISLVAALENATKNSGIFCRRP